MQEKAAEWVRATVEFVKKTLIGAEGGHDWWHIERVRKLALHIGQKEHAQMLVVELGALLHDIADSKFHHGDEERGPLMARNFLTELGVDRPLVEQVEQLIRHVSFKGSFDRLGYQSLELQVVQDADRLDAMGAIGIARAFNFGGYKGRELYNPNVPPRLGMSKDEYSKRQGPTLNHFYEKLLLLKDQMHTSEGRRMAEQRHRFLEQYLEEFLREWDGKV